MLSILFVLPLNVFFITPIYTFFATNQSINVRACRLLPHQRHLLLIDFTMKKDKDDNRKDDNRKRDRNS